jgi:hypothetical protein
VIHEIEDFFSETIVPGENLLKGSIALLQDDLQKFVAFLYLYRHAYEWGEGEGDPPVARNTS